MKHWKKLASVVLALVMAAALMAPAFADGSDPVLSISPEGLATGHTYKVYQLFDGDPVTGENGPIADESQSSKIVEMFEKEGFGWGYSLDTPAKREKFIQELNKGLGLTDDNQIKETATAFEVAQKLSESNKANVAEVIATAAKAAPVGSGNDDARTISKEHNNNGLAVPTGYYLIVEEYEGKTKDILNRHVNDETISPKLTTRPDLEKQVETAFENKNWSDSADYDATKDDSDPSKVNFRIVATIPDNFNNESLTEYSLTIIDQQGDGLTLDEKSVRVYYVPNTVKDLPDAVGDDWKLLKAGTVTENADYTINYNRKYTDPEGKEDKENCTFVIQMANMKTSTDPVYTAGGRIVVTYTSTLDKDAVIGAPGNKNNVWLDYTDREGELPKDDTTVYTFELDVDKIDGASKDPVKGAEFTLYQWIGEDNGEVTDESNWKQFWTYDVPFKQDGNGEDTNEKDFAAGESTFKITGLKAGKYKLVEDSAPAPYNKLQEPIYLNVVAEYDKDNVKKLTVQECNDDWSPKKEASASKADGIVDIDVENNQGVLLPETGGIGTTIFYIVGGVLVVGAVVLLITKRRAGADDE